jgi:hypothetical protein
MSCILSTIYSLTARIVHLYFSNQGPSASIANYHRKSASHLNIDWAGSGLHSEPGPRTLPAGVWFGLDALLMVLAQIRADWSDDRQAVLLVDFDESGFLRERTCIIDRLHRAWLVYRA